MKPMIRIEDADFAFLRSGAPVTIRIEDQEVDLIYIPNKRPKIYNPNGRRRKSAKWKCEQCGKKFRMVSKGVHLLWHRKTKKNGSTK